MVWQKVGFMCQPNPIYLHVKFDALHGRCQGDVLCCSRPSFWIQHPSSIETDHVMRSNVATRSDIHHLTPARDNSIVNNPCCCGVVCLDWSFGLGPPYVDEGLAVGNHLTGCDEESSKFRLSSRCHNKLDDLGNGEHSTVELWKGVIF